MTQQEREERPSRYRFRRHVQIRRSTRTTLANMLQRAKLTATIPDGGSRQLIWPTATTGSRGEKGTNTNRTSFRARSSPSTGRSPIASLEVTGMETIQCRITTRRCDGASTKHAKGHEPCAANNHLDHDDHHRSSSRFNV